MNINKEIHQAETGTEKPILRCSKRDEFKRLCGLDVLGPQEIHIN